jgi:hypothetical protein
MVFSDVEDTHEIDGLRYDRQTGEFRRRGLISGWLIEGTASMNDGVLELSSLAVRPDPTLVPARDPAGKPRMQPPARPGPVTSRLLRSIPVAVLINEIRDRWEWRNAALEALDIEPTEIRVGRRRRTSDPRKQAQLRRVAIAYLAEQREPGVYGRLSGRFRTSEESIKALVRAARADGWLSSTARHGVRGATPGPRLLRDEEYLRRRGEQ